LAGYAQSRAFKTGTPDDSVAYFGGPSRGDDSKGVVMTSSTSRTRVWEIIEKVGVCMLTTRTSTGELKSRPVEARPNRGKGHIYVVTDAQSAKEHEIERDPWLSLTFIHHQEKAYLAISARGIVSSDPAAVKEYWKETDSLWWKGPNDPNVCVIRIELISASLWDGPSSKAVELFEFIKAKVTGAKPSLGENRKIDISLGPT
jgi:general stress protein 26